MTDNIEMESLSFACDPQTLAGIDDNAYEHKLESREADLAARSAAAEVVARQPYSFRSAVRRG